jgi:OmpA-OmpF porin, OOP family
MRFHWKWFAGVVLFVGIAQAQEITLQVELMNTLATGTSRKGDLVSGRLISPAAFQGDIVEGKVTNSKAGNSVRGTSVLSFTFETLKHAGQDVPIASEVQSVSNSKGQAEVDEEAHVIKKTNNLGKVAGATGAGAVIGGLLGGGKGAAIGAASGAVVSIVLIDISADGQSIRLNPGSKVTLTAKSRSGPALSSLSPNAAPTTSPAPAVAAAATSNPPATTQAQSSPDAAAATAQPDMTTLKSTFIPGEKTIFYDDFTDMGPDDPPPHFKVRGAATELRATGNVRQLTVIQGGTILTPNLTALPANFTYEAEMALETGSHRADCALVFYSKNKEVFRLDFYASEPTSDLIAQMKDPYSELGRKRFNTSWKEPGKLALWIQNGRLRVFFKDEKQLDFNQVEMPAIDKVELQHGFSGAQAKSIGYRTIRFAESTPDFSQLISSSGRYVTHGILFDTDSDRIKSESAPVIKLIAQGLEKNPALKLLIEGHTDSVGNADHNLDLSKRRAEAVKTVLVSQFNVDAARLTTTGLGAAKPIDSNDTPQGRSQNRRVELVKQ